MKKLIVLTLLFLGLGIQMNAQSAPGQMPPLTLEDYFSPSTAVPAGRTQRVSFRDGRCLNLSENLV